MSGPNTNAPAQLIQNKWSSIPDGYYIVEVTCGSKFVAIIYRINDGSYGYAAIFGYSSINPYVMRIQNNVWEDSQPLITNSDFKVSDNCQLVGGINTEENNIYIQVRLLDANKNMIKSLHLEYNFNSNQFLLNRMLNGSWGTPQVISVSPKQ